MHKQRLPGERLPLGFIYDCELYDGDRLVEAWVDTNLIPQAGLDYIAQAIFGDTAAIGTFYVGLFENNYLPVEGNVSADIPALFGEFTGYSEATRPLWSRVYDGAGSINNDAARATFTVTQDRRIYGGFLVSNSAKAGNTGLLISAARFASPRDVQAGMTLRVRAGLTLVPTSLV